MKREIPEEGICDARELGLPTMLFLGLQHMFAFFGATVLVPLLTGLSVQITLLMAGACTLIFHFLFTKRMVPAFLGSSFAFLGGYAMIKASSAYAEMPLEEQLAYANGGAIVGAIVCYTTLALIIKAIGVKRTLKYLPPVVTSPMIICIGLSLAPSAIGNASQNWLLAIMAIAIVIIFNVWGKGIWNIVPILMGVIISYVIAVIAQLIGIGGAWANQIDFSTVANASWVGLPPITMPKFDFTAIVIMAPICLATMMEHIGDISAISATTKKNFVEEPGLWRTLLGDGWMSALSLAVGGPPNTTYGENTGVLALSKVFDPRVVRIGAAYAVVFGFMPKIAAVINTMPTAIIGGISFMLYGMISAIGVRNMYENHVSLAKSRNLIIVSVVMVCGLGISDGITFTVGGTDITLTGMAIAAIVGIILNAILPGKDYEYGKDPEADTNRGIAIGAFASRDQ
ncbi:uracil-xanthine permease [Candidatus Saccharibacteria bacterium]|nr:uracil-xanthine permease [Candidatus Saccharibacteria bacterium]